MLVFQIVNHVKALLKHGSGVQPSLTPEPRYWAFGTSASQFNLTSWVGRVAILQNLFLHFFGQILHIILAGLQKTLALGPGFDIDDSIDANKWC